MRSKIEISVETTGSHHLISASSLNTACRVELGAEGSGGGWEDWFCWTVVDVDSAVMGMCFFLEYSFVLRECKDTFRCFTRSRP